MASSVFYRWNSRKDESVTFDGTGISVFDLKRDIIISNNMTKANDFDLIVLDNTTKQELNDDSEIIPRSSSVIVKRVPALARGGRGKAQMYIAGVAGMLPTSDRAGGNAIWHKGAMSKRFDGKDIPGQASTSTPALQSAVTQDDEAAAMEAMFKAQSANWEETQEKMAHQQRIGYQRNGASGGGRGGKTQASFQAPQENRPLPPSYVCYRCGQKGHWIKDCPTNNDREFDNRPRIKRTTGIPRSMLKAVDNPTTEQFGQGVMVTPEGGYVVAQPDSAAWQKQASRPKGLTAAEVLERTPSDASLACPIDNRLFRDAVKTPCCGTTYCEECLQTYLMERDFTCPKCSQKIQSLENLAMDKPTRNKVAEYVEKTIEESRKVEDDAGDSSAPAEGDGSASQEPSFDQQPGALEDMQAMIANIPQLQAQINQISLMLQNPSLPNQVRQTTEMQYQQLHMELQQAQSFAAVAATFQQQQIPGVPPGMFNMQQGWGGTQAIGQDSAYQRLPVNNRRRNVVKRDRPSDFLEIGGEPDNKVARYWE